MERSAPCDKRRYRHQPQQEEEVEEVLPEYPTPLRPHRDHQPLQEEEEVVPQEPAMEEVQPNDHRRKRRVIQQEQNEPHRLPLQGVSQRAALRRR